MQERAVRQGDPASTGLFILGMEILLIRIRSNPAIKKLHVENINVGTSGYADDVNILLKYDRQSLIELKLDLNNFYSISGLKTNLNKTNCMFFGRPEGQEDLTEPFQDTGFDWKDEIKFLGVYIDFKLANTHKKLVANKQKIPLYFSTFLAKNSNFI